MELPYHVPVLLDASIEALKLGDGGGDWMDATFGGGGHSRVILENLNKTGRLFGFDQDPDAAANALDDSRFTLVAANFRYAKQFLSLHGAKSTNGILADLGVSSHQFDTADRGFSLRLDGPLDMRMNPESGISAAEYLEECTWEELMVILRMYGEVNRPDRVARAIVAARDESPIITTEDFVKVLSKMAPGGRENKFYAQVFQALRIEVNDELSALRELLNQATQLLAPGGRLVVISYHSLEDRLVKHFMRSGNFEDKTEQDLRGNILAPFKLVKRKAIVATPEEVMLNPRARSARLRVAERTDFKVAG
ncbi:MAG TPA: 16S rRNA (cytosine(1402)-N(4))-methyltransferase RsmH [Flavobacteriales bacterium]|jgi:16S rRNA (cytosine1402-N4)-methyltransferase|nr:16S rRNA (cytosine(1402)-N(4))-methyltransferase RsmH [Flavobacteriales bacterium]HHZ95689.1 16S rRNA (cytosine(1402)-N(4))-methyltransferase RsmH [Flavobacteriales bacterium]HIB77782.1 16S rRNA (cytosine(1402)-N(4))-methyltransferase RsmH [Flavobacteriales bacterium]HIN41630.1 16S rRNA (cytosine(1402)-N(4))-methyltransferase RsmH [Flavobacteriales bacterium]HIO16667.1 16S rRNA (cytosine(1402)-N(4))-methyltransferase RsmH [Flavobacteriales bacterium]